MRACRVYLSNGTNYVTSINGTDDEIQRYFVGQALTFPDGKGGQVEYTCTHVDIWD
jgi:hypothetical protein